MAQYKESLFNVKNDGGTSISIVNLYYRKALQAAGDNALAVRRLLDDPDKYQETELFKKLQSMRIIVDAKLDEYQLIEYEYYKMAYQTSALSLTLIPTQNCNLLCPYCYQKHVEKEMSELVVKNIISYIKNVASKYKKININWFGGEPLLRKDLVIYMTETIKEIAAKNRCAIISRMTTNGYLLDLETFKKLLSIGILYYQITIDGPSDIHNLQRPHANQDSFEKIIENLREIKQKVSSNLFQISLRTNLTLSGMERVDELFNIYQKIFGDDKRFVIDISMADNWGGDSAKNINFLNHQNFTQAIKTIDEAIKSRKLNTLHREYFNPGFLICTAQKDNDYIIDYDGSIHKCTIAMFFDEYQDISKIGYIGDDGSIVIDKNKHAQWLFNKKDVEHCKKCNIVSICMGRPCVYAVNVKHLNQCTLNSRNNPINYIFNGELNYEYI